MKHTTLIHKSILAAAGFCLAATLTAQTSAKSQESTASEATLVAMASPTSRTKSNMVSPASDRASIEKSSATQGDAKDVASASQSSSPSVWGNATWGNLSPISPVKAALTSIPDGTSGSKSWIKAEPSVLPLAVRLDGRMRAEDQYGAAPAIVNITFGHHQH